MNILLFSRAAWDDTNSVGNTFSNFFEGWDQDRFSHFYVRKQIPHNDCVTLYYNVSVVDVVKKWIGKKTELEKFTAEELPERMKSIVHAHEKEQKNIDRIHRGKHSLVYWAADQIWRSRLWQTAQFRQFVKEADPDVFFAFATNSFLLWPLIQYLKANTRAKIVLFVADDVYNNIPNQPFFRRGYLRTSYRRCMESADQVYGISAQMCDAYSRIFQKEVRLLMKGCEFTKAVSSSINKPLRLVYAGNLLYGREQTLEKIAQALREINRDNVLAQLEIYTGATVTEELQQRLNLENASQIMGRCPYEEIKNVLNQADIVLHVESFQPEQMDTVRYSLSTKIIDCLQSGSGVLAVGPADLSSMKYLCGIDGVEIVDQLEDLKDTLVRILSEADQIPEKAEKIRAYAQEHHDIYRLRRALRDDFLELLSKCVGGEQ